MTIAGLGPGLNLGTTLNFLNSDYLEAWNQHPSSGSLIMPLWDESPGAFGFREGVVLDTRTAQNAVRAADSVLQDCRNFRAALKDEGHQLPQPLPTRAAGWILTTLQDPNVTSGGKARFDHAEQTKTVTLDLLNPATASFEVTLKRGSAELIQKVDVDRRLFHVSTEYYFIKTKKETARRAVELAVLITNLVYRSQQYHVANELGAPPPLYRNGETFKDETPLELRDNLYTFKDNKIPDVNEIQLVSALSVFNSNYREPVMTVSASNLKSDGPYAVSLLLYRPKTRPRRRMPLQVRLQKVLWETIEKKLEGA